MKSKRSKPGPAAGSKKPAPVPKAPAPPAPAPVVVEPSQADAAAEHFVRGALIRGDAAKPVDGKLPPGATHEIVDAPKEGLPTIKRRRFSAY